MSKSKKIVQGGRKAQRINQLKLIYREQLSTLYKPKNKAQARANKRLKLSEVRGMIRKAHADDLEKIRISVAKKKRFRQYDIKSTEERAKVFEMVPNARTFRYKKIIQKGKRY